MTTPVVFDTNILISALLSLQEAPFRCVAMARAGLVQSVTCTQILDEFAEKLQAMFAFVEERIRQAVDEIRACSEVVDVPGLLKVVADDPDDDAIIECAIVGNALLIVSGDRHLRTLNRYKNIRILSANEFLLLSFQSCAFHSSLSSRLQKIADRGWPRRERTDSCAFSRTRVRSTSSITLFLVVMPVRRMAASTSSSLSTILVRIEKLLYTHGSNNL
jgi:uncharacterized protein